MLVRTKVLREGRSVRSINANSIRVIPVDLRHTIEVIPESEPLCVAAWFQLIQKRGARQPLLPSDEGRCLCDAKAEGCRLY